MSNIEFIKNMNPIIRWILLIPTSLFLFIITYPIIYYINYYSVSFHLGEDPKNIFLFEYFLVFISSYVSTALFLACAIEIAPKFKAQIFYILSTITIVLILFVLYYKYDAKIPPTQSWPNLIVSVIASIIAIIQTYICYAETYFHPKKLKTLEDPSILLIKNASKISSSKIIHEPSLFYKTIYSIIEKIAILFGAIIFILFAVNDCVRVSGPNESSEGIVYNKIKEIYQSHYDNNTPTKNIVK